MEDLEKLYSPSQWSRRMTADDLLKYHVKLLNEKSDQLRKILKCDLNIAYGVEPREQYHILGTDLSSDSPILIYIHGGYYQEESLTSTNCHFIAKNFHKNGIKTITIGYELCPKKSVKQILENLQKAVKDCVEYAKKCGSRGIYLAGHSVGAHAIATILSKYKDSLEFEQNLIKGAFLIAGVYDFVPITKMSANVPLKLTEKEAQLELSPLFYNFKNEAGKCATKYYVTVGQFDSPAFVEQSKLFFEKLQRDGIESAFVLIDNVDHFNIIENLDDPQFELTKIIINAINK